MKKVENGIQGPILATLSNFAKSRPKSEILQNRTSKSDLGTQKDLQKVKKSCTMQGGYPLHFGNSEKSKIKRFEIYFTCKSVQTQI